MDIRKRFDLLDARHAVSEEHRVLQAVKVLESGDLEAFGDLMNASHRSLRDDYEVSCLELDVLSEAARTHAGCLGARMTGAGFGGCIVALVKRSSLATFIQEVGDAYTHKTGLQADFYQAQAAEGARRLR